MEGIDTRSLVRHLRDHGSQEAVLSSVDLNPERLGRRAKDSPGLVGRDLGREGTCKEPYEWTQGPWRVGQGYTTAEHAAEPRGGGGGGRARRRLRRQLQQPAEV